MTIKGLCRAPVDRYFRVRVPGYGTPYRPTVVTTGSLAVGGSSCHELAVMRSDEMPPVGSSPATDR